MLGTDLHKDILQSYLDDIIDEIEVYRDIPKALEILWILKEYVKEG
jgi:hypothetical protein